MNLNRKVEQNIDKWCTYRQILDMINSLDCCSVCPAPRPYSRRSGLRTRTATLPLPGSGARRHLLEPSPADSKEALNARTERSSFETLRVGEVPLLSVAEESLLARRIKLGDKAARERMICANLRLVIKIARDYEHLGLPLADLISEGIIGLMKAVDRFNPAKGGKLSTYAGLWVKQQIRRALANQGRTIRLPVHVEGTLYRLRRAEARLRELLGREATEEELARELHVSPRRIALLRQSSAHTTSLDMAIGEHNTGTLAEIVSDETAIAPDLHLVSKTDQQVLRRALLKLPPRLATVVKLRFGLNGSEEHTLEEVGVKLGLTRERIRQLQNEALNKLKLLMDETLLEAAGQR